MAFAISSDLAQACIGDKRWTMSTATPFAVASPRLVGTDGTRGARGAGRIGWGRA